MKKTQGQREEGSEGGNSSSGYNTDTNSELEANQEVFPDS